MESVVITKALMRRLPLYLNYLKNLQTDQRNISATSIARGLGLGDVQVRKDLAKISGEGRRRTGRSREQLIADIERCMGHAAEAAAVIIGSGALGEALLEYSGFENTGVNIVACFDLNPEKKQSESGKTIYHVGRLENFCNSHDVRIGIIAVPPDKAQETCNRLVGCGIQVIWNFSPVGLSVPEDVILQNENLALSGSSLLMQLNAREQF